MALNVEVHQPPVRVIIPDDEPVIFLAGPIQGALDWQHEATLKIAGHYPSDAPTLHIANPRRDVFDRDDFDFDEQVEWEVDHLWRAAQLGACIFWLARESSQAPVPNPPERSYAQTTRFEFADTLGWKRFKPDVAVFLGVEPGYDGSARYYRKRASLSNIPTFSDLHVMTGLAVDSIVARRHFNKTSI